MNDLYLIQDLKGFVEYVKYQLKDNLNPFRLRSALYFAFGYYTGYYRYKLESIYGYTFPKYLFNVDFYIEKDGIHIKQLNHIDTSYIEKSLVNHFVSIFESNNPLLLYELNDLFRELVETNTFDLYDRLFEEPHIKNIHINSNQKDLYNKDIASYYLGECN